MGRTTRSSIARVTAKRFELRGLELVVFEISTQIARQTKLTPSENAVAALVGLGYSNAKIASARGTSERTVANQLASVYAKLGVSSRAELLAHLGDADDTTTL